MLAASAVLKWFFLDRPGELDTQRASDILQAYMGGGQPLLAPPHCLAEVCAVLARERPKSMLQDFQNLLELAIPVRGSPEVYARAVQISHDLSHHLFDTLYHAVALDSANAVLVTADQRYWRGAQAHGRVVQLAR